MEQAACQTQNGGSTQIQIDRVQGYAMSVRPPVGPVSSLGNMPVRNGVLIAITSRDGATGWGEIWCNFPPRGAEARLNLMQDVIGPLLLGMTFQDFSEIRPRLEHDLARMMIHTGEYGPFTHCLAGIDTALADLVSKQAGLPLSGFLTSTPLAHVPVYASTPNISDLEAALHQIIEDGHQGLKLKIGNGIETDTKLLSDVARVSEGKLDICVDANQNWTVNEAIATLNALTNHNLMFVEEPLRADASMRDWAALAEAVSSPLAGGENITSREMFSNFVQDGKLSVIQPDVAKWGGISGAIEVARIAKAKGATCAMHYMGTGLGLAASLHCLAAIDGKGPMELDANPNPLRTELGEINLTLTDGRVAVPQGAGIGFVPDPSALKSMTIAQMELS
ncbi:MAG: mandelate racemase/muconate lactonizing enzyme family protein [Sulfitobacter sp.]